MAIRTIERKKSPIWIYHFDSNMTSTENAAVPDIKAKLRLICFRNYFQGARLF
jgi:hypothetical protein